MNTIEIPWFAAIFGLLLAIFLILKNSILFIPYF